VRNWVALIVLLPTCAPAALAQYRVLPGKIDENLGCMPSTPARICLGAGNGHCYAPASTKNYIFGMGPKAVVVGHLDGQPLILFSAVFDGCGSGTLTDYSMLTIREGEFLNLLPPVRLTNQSEHRLWNLPQVSAQPVLACADFIWNVQAGETHFDPHRYQIDAYVFDPSRGKYLKKLSYATTKEYPGLNEMDEIRVLGAEKPTILARLRAQPRN